MVDQHQCGKRQLVTASIEYEKCLDRYSIAEIVGPNPSTLSTFIILVTYGINSSIFLDSYRTI
jgi:hypothetical protein